MTTIDYTPQRVEHLNRSLLFTGAADSTEANLKSLTEKFRGRSTASGLLLSCKLQKAFSKTK
jgi:hypothetical protein